MIFKFFARNLVYSLSNVRSLPSVRKAMAEARKRDGKCKYCGGVKKLQVHHIEPVSFRPDLADKMENLITLCCRCHLSVGHFNNYKKYNKNSKEEVEQYGQK